MPRRPPSLFLRLALGVLVLGLLTAFTYPLIREGYARVGSDTLSREQQRLLEQSIAAYVMFNPNPGWNVETPTRQILTDLGKGWDRTLSGQRDSFLPPSATVESLSRNYRIVYKSPSSFKVINRDS